MHAVNLEELLQEAMRLQPVAASPLQRVAVQDFKLSNGVVIPAGVTIDLAQYTVMQDDAWGWKDGASFNPVRNVSSSSAGQEQQFVQTGMLTGADAGCVSYRLLLEATAADQSSAHVDGLKYCARMCYDSTLCVPCQEDASGRSHGCFCVVLTRISAGAGEVGGT